MKTDKRLVIELTSEEVGQIIKKASNNGISINENIQLPNVPQTSDPAKIIVEIEIDGEKRIIETERISVIFSTTIS